MIIDLRKFIATESPYWAELESTMDHLEKDRGFRMNLEQIRRFHYLYQRASSDLSRIVTFSSEPHILRYLESLVARAYGEIHETRKKSRRLAPVHWFFHIFPRTFRRHLPAFYLSLAITFAGGAFGGFAVSLDPEAKEVLMPFEHLQLDPSERVAREKEQQGEHLQGVKTTFSSSLMTHNTKVSIFALASGMTWGIGTVILLFTNGVTLGAVALDYIRAGETSFLAGWLLPHGAVEIPAILLAGQAGLVLAGALIGWGMPISFKARLRKVSNDLVTLIFGVAIMLVWAGIVEGFFSQYHEPVLPYEAKIAFGMVELILLALFLGRSGGRTGKPKDVETG